MANNTVYRHISYDDMQNLTVNDCMGLIDTFNGEKVMIKGHEVFLIDFRDNWGYSALVFLNGKHLHYADDFQLHHESRSVAELRKWYIDSMNRKLFTLDELKNSTPSSYDEYKARNTYIREYFVQSFDKLSIFFIGSKEAEAEYESKLPSYPYYSNVGFAHFKDEKVVELIEGLVDLNEERWKALQSDNEKFREAIRHELCNHEAGYSMDYAPALAALGLTIKSLTSAQRVIVIDEFNKCVNSAS